MIDWVEEVGIIFKTFKLVAKPQEPCALCNEFSCIYI